MDLAVMPRLAARKATIGEPGEAGTARFFTLWEIAQNRPRRFAALGGAESYDRRAGGGGHSPLSDAFLTSSAVRIFTIFCSL